MKTCILFNVDDHYLEGFKVLCYSLQKTGSFSGQDKLVLTTSAEVAADPFVRAIAKVRMIPEEFLRELDAFRIHYAGHPLPKVKENRELFIKVKRSTFSKLYALTDLGYDKHIFLDADLLCLNNADFLLTGCNDHAFYAAPALRKSQVTDANGHYYSAERTRELEENHFDAVTQSGIAFNSGVFVANRPVLGDRTVRELVSIGRSGDYSGDQPILTDFFRRKQFSYMNISPWFNVERPFYYVIGADNYKRHRGKIRFLHYTGMKKPWWPFDYAEPTIAGVEFLYREWQQWQSEAGPWIAGVSASGLRAVEAEPPHQPS